MVKVLTAIKCSGFIRRMLVVACAVATAASSMLSASEVNDPSGNCSVIAATLDFGDFPASKPYAESEGLVGLSCTDVNEIVAARFALRLPERVEVLRDERVVATIGIRGDRTMDDEGEPLSVVYGSDIEQTGRTTEVFFSIPAWIEVASTFSREIDFDIPFQIAL